MYQYEWDESTGGLLLTSTPSIFSKEPRPVYYKELDLLGFNLFWKYAKDDSFPYMWAESNCYLYRGRLVAKIKGGNLYQAPEIEIIEDPEPRGESLRFVDIDTMVSKNETILESFSQETIKKIYNTYDSYSKKVEIFYVAFSGGKDSIVLLDLVKKSLPHNAFKVVFGNTDMEFPTTLRLIKNTKENCRQEGLDFIIAKSNLTSTQSWNLFGPPARQLRWCCSVHKSAPVINKLSQFAKDGMRLKVMMITGIRRDESFARSDYEELSLGKKITGQYSFHPIIEWSSAELYLYIYKHMLQINEAYKLGFSRVGCIMCPNSSDRHEFIKRINFPEIVDEFCNMIVNTSRKDLTGDNQKVFLSTGGWKMRNSGRELNFSVEKYTFSEKTDRFVFVLNEYSRDWEQWYKTIGKLIKYDDNHFELEYNNVRRILTVSRSSENTILEITNKERTKNSIEFISLFKVAITKSLYCIKCNMCIAECAFRNISMKEDSLYISDNCCKCRACMKIKNGCIYYNSIKDNTKGIKKMTGLNRYLSVGVSGDWIKLFFADNTYEPGNRKSDTMFAFLNDSGILQKRKEAILGTKIKELGLDSDISWALMLCNLCYTPAFGWFIKSIPLGIEYTEEKMHIDLADQVTDKAKGEFWNGFKIILYTMPWDSLLNFAVPQIEEKKLKNGMVQLKMYSGTIQNFV